MNLDQSHCGKEGLYELDQSHCGKEGLYEPGSVSLWQRRLT